jgi:hypothetical protein
MTEFTVTRTAGVKGMRVSRACIGLTLVFLATSAFGRAGARRMGRSGIGAASGKALSRPAT